MISCFDDLKNNTTEEQRVLLNALWDYSKQHGSWCSVLRFHNEHGKPNVLKCFKGLGGDVVYYTDDNVNGTHANIYKLSFLGILLTEDGPKVTDLASKYCKCVRDKFNKSPDARKIFANEVVSMLELSPEEIKFLGRLGINGCISYGDYCHGEDWDKLYPKNIDEYAEIPDFKKYVENLAFGDYDPVTPLAADKHYHYRMGKQQSNVQKSRFSFIDDKSYRKIAEDDWVEAKAVYDVKAWKSCIILCGGILEAMLIGVLSANKEESLNCYKGIHGKRENINKWTLEQLIEVAASLTIIDEQVTAVGQVVRDFRNLVHPGKIVRKNYNVSSAEAGIAIHAIEKLLNDFQK